MNEKTFNLQRTFFHFSVELLSSFPNKMMFILKDNIPIKNMIKFLNMNKAKRKSQIINQRAFYEIKLCKNDTILKVSSQRT